MTSGLLNSPRSAHATSEAADRISGSEAPWGVMSEMFSERSALVPKPEVARSVTTSTRSSGRRPSVDALADMSRAKWSSKRDSLSPASASNVRPQRSGVLAKR